MKRKWFAALLIGVMVCMTACGTEKENPPVEEPNQVEKVSKEQPESTDEQLRRNAYADALLKLLQERIFPDGVQADYESNSKFAVYDIDGDGRNELLINYSGECMAGTVLKIYDYDIETRAFRAELSEFPGVIFYGNGIIEAGLSHNHGLASDSEDFWPYTLYEYHKESDMYQSVAFVDGWTKTWKRKNMTEFRFRMKLMQTGTV